MYHTSYLVHSFLVHFEWGGGVAWGPGPGPRDAKGPGPGALGPRPVALGLKQLRLLQLSDNLIGDAEAARLEKCLQRCWVDM